METPPLLLDFVVGGGKVFNLVARGSVSLGLANFDDEVSSSLRCEVQKLGLGAATG